MTNESAHTYKVIELVGSSPTSTDEAIRNAIDRAGETLSHLNWFEVREVRGRIEDGRVGWFQVTLAVGFRVLSSADMEAE